MADLTLTAEQLIPVVRGVLSDPSASADGWECRPMTHHSEGLYRVRGTAGARPWEVVLKRFPPGYGWREVASYQSDLLRNLPPWLGAPRCLHVERLPDEATWLWIEAVTASSARAWPMERFGLAARHLGRWAGLYLTERPLPADRWLQRGWVRPLAAEADPWLVSEEAWSFPVMQETFGPGAQQRVAHLYARREELFALLESLPQVPCHFDTYSRNLYARGDEQTVLIDWNMTGIGAVGEELAQMVAGSVLFDLGAGALPALEAAALEGYAAGLAEAGWQVDRRQVETAYAIHFAIRWAISSLPALFMLLGHDDAEALVQQKFGLPLSEAKERIRTLFLHALDLTEQIRA